MSSTEKIKMLLHIGGVQVPVTVPFSDQENVREVESQVDHLYTSWRRQFTNKTDAQILAMVAYQFAKHYSDLRAMYEQATERAMRCHAAMQELEGKEPDQKEAAKAEDPVPEVKPDI